MKKLKPLVQIILIAAYVFSVSCSKEKDSPLPNENAAKSQLKSILPPSPVSVYGVWHAGNDYCSWATVRNMTDFDIKNHWLIDRGNGSPAGNIKRNSKRNDIGCCQLFHQPRRQGYAFYRWHYLYR